MWKRNETRTLTGTVAVVGKDCKLPCCSGATTGVPWLECIHSWPPGVDIWEEGWNWGGMLMPVWGKPKEDGTYWTWRKQIRWCQNSISGSESRIDWHISYSIWWRKWSSLAWSIWLRLCHAWCHRHAWLRIWGWCTVPRLRRPRQKLWHWLRKRR